ncbi:MAG: Gfo/Idh/MocA family oxidoreductase [Actinomycetota bacterium]|nr:Gfo/Idh/MocA family oxidoreductase [Actinomycetota bacterium]
MTNPAATVRIGFLGAGLIATYHSKSLRHSGAPVVRAGVFDPDTERAAAFAAASGHTVYADEDAVIADCDAVYICTWTSEHPRQLAKAVAAGKHVFCEKPLAFDAVEAQRMADAADCAGITHQVGLVLRFSHAYLWAKHLVTDPTAGRVMSVVFRDDQFIPIQGHYSSTWRSDKALVGAGTLLEHSIHDVDMLQYLVGDVQRLSANTANFHGHEGIEDVATATLRFAGGATGTLTSVWHDNLARPSLRRVEIFCERRHIVIEGDDWYGPVSWTDTDGTSGSLADQALTEAVAPMRDGSDNPDGEFIRAVLAGSGASPDLHTAVAAHRIVDAMYASAAAGGEAIDVVSA